MNYLILNQVTKKKKSYKEMLDKKSINIIENKYKKELNFFKYKY